MSYCFFFFFFKQKTAYEMRISDGSSDVCSSDLQKLAHPEGEQASALAASAMRAGMVVSTLSSLSLEHIAQASSTPLWFQLYLQADQADSLTLIRRADRKSVVTGTSVSVRVDPGGRRILKKKKTKEKKYKR